MLVELAFAFCNSVPAHYSFCSGPDMKSFLLATCRLAIQRAKYQSTQTHLPSSSAALSQSRPEDLPEIIDLLEKCMQLVPHLVSFIPPELQVPILAHPQLSAYDIILNADTTGIKSYTDWQGVSVLPFIMRCYLPKLFQYENTLISWPPTLDHLPPELIPQAKAELPILKREVLARRLLFKMSPKHLQAWMNPFMPLLVQFCNIVPRVWADGPILLRYFVYEVVYQWPEETGIACPVQISEAEMEKQALEFQKAVVYDTRIDEEVAYMGCDPDGWVPDDESFERAKEVMKQLKEGWEEEDGPFPFEDGRYSSGLT